MRTFNIERRTFNPSDYTSSSSYGTINPEDVVVIRINAKVGGDDKERMFRDRFYTKMLNAVRDDLFDEITMTLRREMVFCVVVCPDEKYEVLNPLRKTDIHPEKGIGDGFRYVNNLSGLYGTIKTFLQYEVPRTMSCVMFMKPKKPNELNFRGAFIYPRQYKWALTILPETSNK